MNGRDGKARGGREGDEGVRIGDQHIRAVKTAETNEELLATRSAEVCRTLRGVGFFIRDEPPTQYRSVEHRPRSERKHLPNRDQLDRGMGLAIGHRPPVEWMSTPLLGLAFGDPCLASSRSGYRVLGLLASLVSPFLSGEDDFAGNATRSRLKSSPFTNPYPHQTVVPVRSAVTRARSCRGARRNITSPFSPAPGARLQVGDTILPFEVPDTHFSSTRAINEFRSDSASAIWRRDRIAGTTDG